MRFGNKTDRTDVFMINENKHLIHITVYFFQHDEIRLIKHWCICCYFQYFNISLSLRWRHNGRDRVSNHQPYDCFINRLFRRRSKKTSKLRVTVFLREIHWSPVNSTHTWSVTRKIFPFDGVIMFRTGLRVHTYITEETRKYPFLPISTCFVSRHAGLQ